jgi:hypothetical protein
MIPLNLPTFDYKLKKAEGKLWIFDIIRKKYVVLLPEEWVRQHFVNFMVNHLSYPRSLIKIEGGLIFNQLQKRADIVVFSRHGRPWMLIECKAPEVPISSSTLFQAATYNSKLHANFIAVSNGLTHLYAETNWELGTTKWVETMPGYEAAGEIF